MRGYLHKHRNGFVTDDDDGGGGDDDVDNDMCVRPDKDTLIIDV